MRYGVGRVERTTEDETDQTNWRSRRISGAAFFVVWIRGLVRSTTEELACVKAPTSVGTYCDRSLAPRSRSRGWNRVTDRSCPTGGSVDATCAAYRRWASNRPTGR